MKTKFITAFSTAAFVTLAMFSTATAAETNDTDMRDRAMTETSERGNTMGAREGVESRGETMGARERGEFRGNATDTKEADERATTSKDMEEEHSAAKEHRSEVATFVKSLLNIADRDGGIGEKVREVAHEQDDVASTTADTIEKVEKRSKIATFFFGTDYKNLGQLRSELVKTESNIEKLKGLVSEAATKTNKTELENQIKALENTRAKVDAFITEREDAFSLFGWVAKMFAK